MQLRAVSLQSFAPLNLLTHPPCPLITPAFPPHHSATILSNNDAPVVLEEDLTGSILVAVKIKRIIPPWRSVAMSTVLPNVLRRLGDPTPAVQPKIHNVLFFFLASESRQNFGKRGDTPPKEKEKKENPRHCTNKWQNSTSSSHVRRRPAPVRWRVWCATRSRDPTWRGGTHPGRSPRCWPIHT